MSDSISCNFHQELMVLERHLFSWAQKSNCYWSPFHESLLQHLDTMCGTISISPDFQGLLQEANLCLNQTNSDWFFLLAMLHYALNHKGQTLNELICVDWPIEYAYLYRQD